jgi:hypothetical protein
MTSDGRRVEPLPAEPVPWGDRRLLLDVAGGPYLFTGMSDEQWDVSRLRFDAFLLDPASAPTTIPAIRFLRAPTSCFRYPELDGPDYPLSMGDDAHRVTVDGYRFTAVVPTSPDYNGRVWTSVAGGDEFLGVFENPFRATVAYRLLDIGGVLLHSAAVVDNGQVYVFHGRSGAGKSTLSQLAAASGRTVLSDDLNTLIREAGSTVARPVPFAGSHRDPSISGHLPVRALLRLEKGDRVRVRETSPAVSLASLIACSPFVNGDGHRVSTLEDNLERAQRSVKLGVLTSRRDATFDDILGAIEGMT